MKNKTEPQQESIPPATGQLRKIQLVELQLLKELDKVCRDENILYWIDGGTLLGAIRHGGFIPWDDDIDICMPRNELKRFLAKAHKLFPDYIEIDHANIEQDADYAIPCRIRDKRTKIIETKSTVHLNRGLFIDIIPIDSFHVSGPRRVLEICAKVIYRYLCKLYKPQRNATFIDKVLVMFHFLMTGLLRLKADTPIRLFRNWVRKRFIYRPFNDETNGDLGYGFDVYWKRIFKKNDIFPLQRIKFESIEVNAPHRPENVLPIFYGSSYMQPPPIDKRNTHHFSTVIFDTDITQKILDKMKDTL
ncbi:hypothetical protein A3K93_11090 [Acinetobacter sp. NCu2D-2]|uniref:LicD family protein n=1 Tax=Acinetobacter sp. NCu2D-2 TaxID=1608473 RepID=UPI0007CDBFF6|nr:LicD family protein [Acinetobacter sp. NCu2D-2]ANF82680.1 hypothetical protein A3K93_11090 [Acinetobacter sp. NCu2D-2]